MTVSKQMRELRAFLAGESRRVRSSGHVVMWSPEVQQQVLVWARQRFGGVKSSRSARAQRLILHMITVAWFRYGQSIGGGK